MLKSLIARRVTSDNFRAFGQVIFPTQDGQSFGAEDAQLHLSEGIPRFYLMQLFHRGLRFHSITRHQRCTQCLGALAGQDWLMAVAPPGAAAAPDPALIQAFRIPGNCFIKLDVGTWHAGPYFEAEVVSFYNLELSDTNITDHETCNLKATYDLEFEIR